MQNSISPVVGASVIVAVIVVIAIAMWLGMQKHVTLPSKPPSGPIVLPPSQQNRTMPRGRPSGPSTL